MPAKKRLSAKTIRLIDEALAAIIDQWYLSVSDYYITAEKKSENAAIEGPIELKRFHDETGHRIKFNKGDLDFTYGLCLAPGSDNTDLEVSVNNKVAHFDYADLVRRLSSHYEGFSRKPIEGYKKLKKICHGEVFVIPQDLQNCISVEQREGKADIIRLTFGIQEQYLDDLIQDPPNLMELIHQYCVAPLRRVYAEVYRRKRT